LENKELIRICVHCRNVLINNEWVEDLNIKKEIDQKNSKEEVIKRLSHGLCPECLKIHYPSIYKKMLEKSKKKHN
jgi:NMD protein affecting ribosome stability and mRNA decay